MLNQPFHKGSLNIGSTIPKDYEFFSNSQSDQDVDGKSVAHWNETDYIEGKGNQEIHTEQDVNKDCKASGRLLQYSMDKGVTHKDFEMNQRQKFFMDKGDVTMDAECGFVIKQKRVSAGSKLHRRTCVPFTSSSKTSNRFIDKLNIDEDIEAPVSFKQQKSGKCSVSKDSVFSDFSEVATRNTNEEIKTEIEQNVHWEGEKSENNSTEKKLSFMSRVMDCSQHCVDMNGIHCDGTDTGVIILHSKSLQNQPVKKCLSTLDDWLQTSNGINDIKMKTDHNDDDKNEGLFLLDDCSVDDVYLESPCYSDSLAVEDLQKQEVSDGGLNREVVSPAMDSDILPLNDFESVEDLSPQSSLYDSTQSVQDSALPMQDSIQPLLGCTQSVHGNTQSVQDSSQSMQDSSQSMQDSSQSMQDSSQSMQDSSQSMQDSSKSMQDSSQSMQDSSKSMQDSSQSMQDNSQSVSSTASTSDSISQRDKVSDISDSKEQLTITDSGYFSSCDLVESSSEFTITTELCDSSEQEQTAMNCSERNTDIGDCNLTLGNVASSSVSTLSLSFLLSPGGSSHFGSNLQSVNHPLNSGEQQRSLHIQRSPASSRSLFTERNSTDISDTGKCQAGKTSASSSPALTASPGCSCGSPKPLADRRHIRSILNTYVSHRLKPDVCNDSVSDITDELALILRSSRKRVATGTDANTIPVKKSNVMETNSSGNSKECKKKSKTDVGKDVSKSAWSRIKVKPTVQNPDALLVVCSMCDISSSSVRTGQCKNGHAVCQTCLEDHVRLVMASDKVHLSCPEMSCNAAISLDSLSHVLPPLVVDILNDNLRLKAQKATAKAMKKMRELVICPHCACPGMLDEWTLQFVCGTCNSNCCRYCKAAWFRYEEHDGCFLLSFVGAECLQDIVKVPRNWDVSITPFNKNYVQVNVPLDSAEGSTVAAFFAKTSSRGANVIQVFRIQNRKLWEKYVLKRKHVEEEIGTAELKEKFLFHGTRAENIVSICSEGFDIRVPTANGALLGKGIYFSATVKYSERYTDQSHMMYLARVICGWSQQGQKLLTRPEYHSKVRRMYDSCVNDTASPTIFTVFDNSQCYPEYLIQFEH
ncbi:unnamed protein product [Candidula unifasciata]|uniref:Poly [ADP-ribose] polymerase n=1 Tax=Candidula unifasciata TaxID=100452 RepID=A0A8S3YIA6_9EUPU|nr:unnamed protein product [Candidula unifasciata]